MDITLSNIVRNFGFSSQFQYDVRTDWNYVVYKFVPGESFSGPDLRRISERITTALNASKFSYAGAAFEKNERAGAADYWAFVVRVSEPLRERALDRDVHGNLIFVRTKKRTT